MTRDILVYTLACGCTDWCTCKQCGQSDPHPAGTPWGCNDHGVTTVVSHVEVPELNPPVDNGSIVVVGSHDTFTLSDDHPMCAARCGICALPIGVEPVAVIALAGLGGPSCDCGLIPSSVYLIHGTHLTLTPDEMMPFLEVAMNCQNDHPWTE